MTKSSPASRVQANLQDLFKENITPGDAYIQFQLTSDMTALFPMEKVQESLVVEADKITPLPSMPESVIGIMSSRDRVFCVFDLAQLLTLSSRLISPRQYQIIVLEVSELVSADCQKLHLGMAVKRLQGITRLTSEQINSDLNSLPNSLTSYLQGCVVQENQTTPIFNLSKLIQSLTQY